MKFDVQRIDTLEDLVTANQQTLVNSTLTEIQKATQARQACYAYLSLSMTPRNAKFLHMTMAKLGLFQ
jgi:hypothetical protein